MARQPRSSQRNYQQHVKPIVSCAVCRADTTDYRPTVINNKPVWVCKEH